MTRMGAEYTLASMVVAALVWLVGVVLLGAGEGGIRLGVVAGLVVQVGVFWGLFVLSFQGRWGLAHGIGAMVRFDAVAVMALTVVARGDHPAAPVLFSFVACLFGCTLLEPIFLKRQQAAAQASGMAMIRTES